MTDPSNTNASPEIVHGPELVAASGSSTPGLTAQVSVRQTFTFTEEELEAAITHPKLKASGLDWQAITWGRYGVITGKGRLEELGFAPEQSRHAPGILMPLWSWEGGISGWQYRPDTPRIDEDGHPVKYELPPGAPVVASVSPLTTNDIRDFKTPLLITEGVFKADSFAAARLREGQAALGCIAILGVSMWRGPDPLGYRGMPLPLWYTIQWKHEVAGSVTQRTLYLVWDSDARMKRPVYDELVHARDFFKSRGADVKLVVLPTGAKGEKQGLDDFLANGGTTTDVLNLATRQLPAFGAAGELTPLTWQDLLHQPPMPWLLDGMLPQEGITVVFGDKESFKSFTVLDWLVCVASGVPDWFGVPIKRHGPVVYIYAEGKLGFGQRVQALALARHLPDVPDFLAFPHSINVPDEDATDALIARVGEQLQERQPVAIAIDTLARNMPGRDENKQIDMNAFIAGCDRFRQAFGCQVIIVHHTNKEERIKGSTNLPQAADTVLKMERGAGLTATLSTEKQKDGAKLGPWSLTLRPEAASVVLASVEAGTAVTQGRPGQDPFKNSPRRQQLLNILDEAMPKGLTSVEWRRLAEQQFEVGKGAFNGARAWLAVNRYVELRDGERWCSNSIV